MHDLDGAAIRLPGARRVGLGQVLLLEAEAGRDLLGQPVQGVDPLGEDHHAALGAGADAEIVLEGAHERVELGGVLVGEVRDQCLQLGQGLALGGESGAAGGFLRLGPGLATLRRAALRVVQVLTASGEGYSQGDVGGEERLQEVVADQRIGADRRTVGVPWGPLARQLLQDGDLLRRRRSRHRQGGPAFGPGLALETVAYLAVGLGPPDVEVVEVGDLVVLGVGDRRRVEHADQLGEGFRVAVVRGGGGQDQCIGLLGEAAGEPVVAGALVHEVVRFVDDDRVPGDVLQVVGVGRRLEGVDRHDDPFEVGERVPAGRDLLLDALDAGGVQAHQRQGEAGPQLALELLQHMGGRDHEDALTAPATDQLRERDADLQRLAQADHIGDQQSGLRVAHGQRQLGGAQLMLLPVHQEGVGERDAVLGLRQRGLADDRLQVEAGLGVLGGVVGDEPGLARVEHVDLVQA